MELLKCKSVIALVIMMLGVSYITALDNVDIQTQTCDNVEIKQNA